MNKIYDDFWALTLDTKINEVKDGAYTFEQTVFWGEKGGMPSDKGTINGLPVTEIFWEGDRVWHRVEGTLSDPIHMEVDPDTRLTNTSAQSCLHLFDGYYEKRGHVIIAIGAREGNQWFEVDQKEVTDKDLDDLQAYIDEAILRDIPLELTYIPGKDYPDPAYQAYDEVRMVKYGDLDEQPCSTPHVHSTGEIGACVIFSAEKTSRGSRVHLAMGPTVGRLLVKKEALLKKLEGILQANEAQLQERVEALVAGELQLKEEKKALEERLVDLEADRLAGQDDLVACLSGYDGGGLRQLGQKLVFEKKLSKVLLSEDKGKWNLVFASAEGKARDWLDQVREPLGIRGGGSPQLVNGQTRESQEAILTVLQNLK